LGNLRYWKNKCAKRYVKECKSWGVSHKKQLFLQTKITMPAATIMFLGGWQAEKQIKITYYNN